MKKTIIIAIVVVLVIIAWILVSPLFITNEVNEEVNIDTELYRGNFLDADVSHKTSGEAIVSGENILTLQNFETTNGPDLYVYLATDLEASDYNDLGRLKGNIGNQNYDIPEGADLEEYDKVLIWCKAFGVLFGSAELN